MIKVWNCEMYTQMNQVFCNFSKIQCVTEIMKLILEIYDVYKSLHNIINVNFQCLSIDFWLLRNCVPKSKVKFQKFWLFKFLLNFLKTLFQRTHNFNLKYSNIFVLHTVRTIRPIFEKFNGSQFDQSSWGHPLWEKSFETLIQIF